MQRLAMALALLLVGSAGCADPYVRIYHMLETSPRPAVRIVGQPPVLDGTDGQRALPPGYDELAGIVARTIVRDWPNDAVAVGAPLPPPAVTAEVWVRGHWSKQDRRLLVNVDLLVRKAPGGDWVGRPWVLASLTETGDLDAALTKLLERLRTQVAAGTATWVKDVKAVGTAAR